MATATPFALFLPLLCSAIGKIKLRRSFKKIWVPAPAGRRCQVFAGGFPQTPDSGQQGEKVN
jgi:hypothetical protein